LPRDKEAYLRRIKFSSVVFLKMNAALSVTDCPLYISMTCQLKDGTNVSVLPQEVLLEVSCVFSSGVDDNERVSGYL
jgi:hypothetical protein